jgi:hypothetical protein
MEAARLFARHRAWPPDRAGHQGDAFVHPQLAKAIVLGRQPTEMGRRNSDRGHARRPGATTSSRRAVAKSADRRDRPGRPSRCTQLPPSVHGLCRKWAGSAKKPVAADHSHGGDPRWSRRHRLHRGMGAQGRGRHRGHHCHSSRRPRHHMSDAVKFAAFIQPAAMTPAEIAELHKKYARNSPRIRKNSDPRDGSNECCRLWRTSGRLRGSKQRRSSLHRQTRKT